MTFRGELLPDGRVRVPARAEGPGGLIGDGIRILSPGDEGFDVWRRWLSGEKAVEVRDEGDNSVPLR